MPCHIALIWILYIIADRRAGTPQCHIVLSKWHQKPSYKYWQLTLLLELSAPLVLVGFGKNCCVNALLRYIRVSITCWHTSWAACGCIVTLPPLPVAVAALRLDEVLCCTWKTLARQPRAASIPNESHADWLICFPLDWEDWKNHYQKMEWKAKKLYYTYIYAKAWSVGNNCTGSLCRPNA